MGLIWGVGKALRGALEHDGIRTIGDLLAFDEAALVRRYGAMGRRLYHFSRGQDDRRVDPDAPTKSISAETTFETDISAFEALADELRPLCESVARRLKHSDLAGRTVTLKLKTEKFQLLTRRQKLSNPTQLAERIHSAARALLAREAVGRAFRLIGAGVIDLCDGAEADPPDLLDPERPRHAKVEQAIDTIRDRMGSGSIAKGRIPVPAGPAGQKGPAGVERDASNPRPAGRSGPPASRGSKSPRSR